MSEHCTKYIIKVVEDVDHTSTIFCEYSLNVSFIGNTCLSVYTTVHYTTLQVSEYTVFNKQMYSWHVDNNQYLNSCVCTVFSLQATLTQ